MKVGIDLGNHSSCIAIQKPDGSLLAIPDTFFSDELVTPSALCIEGNTILIGKPAIIRAEQDNRIAIYKNLKTKIATPIDSPQSTIKQSWHPDALLSLILKKLKYDCEAFCGEPIQGVVLTVPGYFSEQEKRTYQIAASLADLPLLDILEEATATAQAFATQLKKEGLFMVYDFSHSQLGLTIVHIQQEEVTIVEQITDKNLGAAILLKKVKLLIQSLLQDTITDFSPYINQQIQKATIEIIQQFTNKEQHYFKTEITVGNKNFPILMDRTRIEKLIQPTIEKTIEKCLECFDKAALSLEALDGIILVGGGASFPNLRPSLATTLNTPIEKIHQFSPQQSIAFGAAILANNLPQKSKLFNLPVEYKGLSGYQVGLKIADLDFGQCKFDVLIEPNLPLPCTANRVYYITPKEAAKTILDVIVNQDDTQEAISIGQLEIDSILNNQPNQVIEVSLTNTLLGKIKMTVYNRVTGEEIESQFAYMKKEDQRILQQRQLLTDVLINDFV